jgi:hypothetical protein
MERNKGFVQAEIDALNIEKCRCVAAKDLEGASKAQLEINKLRKDIEYRSTEIDSLNIIKYRCLANNDLEGASKAQLEIKRLS